MTRGILWGEEITTRPTYGSPMRALGSLVERARRLPPIAIDGAIGAGIFALGGLGQHTSPDRVHPHPQRPAATAVGSPTVPGAGLGLRIAKWAVLIDGRAETGPSPEGGFGVRAPLAEERVPV